MAEIRNAADDCLGTNVVSLTRAQWAALGPAQVASPVVRVNHGPVETVCPGGETPDACATFPRISNLGTSTYMLPGPYIGLNDDVFTANDEVARALLTHEILHTLGVAHAYASASVSTVIPGTVRGGQPSIMQPFGDSLHRLTLTAEDVRVIDTLYSNRPGSSCYVHAFEDVCSTACTRISLTSVSGECCSCNGVLGAYVRSSYSATTYLCQ